MSTREIYETKKSMSKQRHIKFTLPFKIWKRIYEAKTCFYTGIELDERFKMTFERVDPKKGYEVGNVVPVILEVNNIKSNASSIEDIDDIIKNMKNKIRDIHEIVRPLQDKAPANIEKLKKSLKLKRNADPEKQASIKLDIENLENLLKRDLTHEIHRYNARIDIANIIRQKVYVENIDPLKFYTKWELFWYYYLRFKFLK